MRRTMRRSIVLAVLLLPLLLTAGSGNRTGTNGASELLIPVGARDIAMGGAGASTTRGIEGLFWNPAALATMEYPVTVYVSRMNYLADMAVNYGAVGTRIEGFGTLAFNIKAVDIGDIPVTSTLYPDGTGQTFSPQFFTLGLTYARALSDRVSVGLTTMLISEGMGDVSATGIAFSAGVVYDELASVKGLSLGVTVKNIGPQMKFSGSGLLVLASVAEQNRPPQYYSIEAAPFEIPSSIEFGAGYRMNLGGVHQLQLASSFQSNNFTEDEYKLGAEYSYQDLVFLRGGYVFAQAESASGPYLFGPSFGAGVHASLGSLDVTIDYAYRGVEVFGANHVFGVKLGF